MIQQVETVEKHIDEPIKKCVVGLNLLGISTAMSCCGFSYKCEEVPKSHLGKAYIYIPLNKPLNSNLLIDLAIKSRWGINAVGNEFLDFFVNPWPANHPWANPQSPHFYENQVLGISYLEKAIDFHSKNFLEQVTIMDGNSIYKEQFKIKYWQYEPAADWVVTPETYKNL